LARRIKVTFPASGVEVVATMLEEEAPMTCDAIWGFLDKPIEGMVRHAYGLGPELWIFTPPAPDLPYENATVFPIPGDFGFYHYEGQLPNGEKIYDIGIFYGRGAKSLTTVGWEPTNVFATVTENLEGLQRVASEVIETGPKAIKIERLP
jgi:hypothetical protein